MATLKPGGDTRVTASSHGSDISTPPPEKSTTDQPIDLERLGEQHGYALDETVLKQQLGLPADAVLKKDATGRVLIPQPSDSPLDPLNWSPWKKRSILIMLAIASFTCDYSAATGASALLVQAETWHISPNTVNHATAGNTFMLGVGGLVTVWLSAYFGRLPVLFYFTVIAAATAIWSAAAGSFESYMASRILNGFFVVAAAGGGLMWINDVFFFHERPRMINIWSCAIILSPFLGPLFMAAVLQVSTWRVGMYLNFGIIMASLVTIVILGDETFFPRHKPISSISNIYAMPRWQRLLGLAQTKTRYTDNTILGSAARLWQTATRLPVFLICFFYFLDFGWTVANNTTISVILVPAYQLDYYGLASIYCSPVIGAILGIPLGHFLFDFIGRLWARRHNGIIAPEARLIPLWIVLPLKIAGYNMIGVTMQRHLNIWVLIVGWGMHNLATILTTSAVSAYLIDCYPEASGESAAWLNAVRTLAGFILGYVQINWAHSAGTEIEYGIQTAIMGGAFLVFVVPTTIFGSRIRKIQGPLKFKTN
ncbi:hypothetical protein OHC33_006787 [Knufia fluminis]|uniref:Major facilitator superfamily (MFS) profile domain-containing protein n=1 Tax=Knufia fluminis TaxID=191047 RepID=A0AAN8ECJ0_9EURO|nr:hypothetical protein OHC33_006787 [Knufia fluminis]